MFTETVIPVGTPNQALHLTRREHRGCNRCVPCAGSLSLGLGRFPMHLVMFDIDGTLTETMKVDEDCFVRSFKDVFGFADIDTDWLHYPHTTDSGIFHEIYTSRRGRSPTALDVSRFRQHFIGLLAAASSQFSFAPVAGADRLLSRLAQGSSYRAVLAS